MRVEYHPALEGELRQIRDYCDRQSPGLGAQFIDEFERQVVALAATRDRWMVVAGDLRRCLMRRFPYVIFFGKSPTDVSGLRWLKTNGGIPGMAKSASSATDQ